MISDLFFLPFGIVSNIEFRVSPSMAPLISKGNTDSASGPAKAVPLSVTLGKATPLSVVYIYLAEQNRYLS